MIKKASKVSTYVPHNESPYTMLDSNQIPEMYTVLLLGVKDTPMPSLWHLQKEMFIASRAIPKIAEAFNFVHHYHGPYSQILQETAEEPLYFNNAYEIMQKSKRIRITRYGKDCFHKITSQYKDNKRFSEMLQILELVREVYDKFTSKELLFLVYKTYPEYADKSSMYDRLVTNEKNRNRLADALLVKELVTEERWMELKQSD